MKTAEKIKLLVEHGDSIPVKENKKIFGLIPYTTLQGYLWLEDNEGYWMVYLANGEKDHFPIPNPVVGVEISKATSERVMSHGLTGAWQSAISMWPVRDEEKARNIFDLIVGKIDKAYDYISGQTQAA